MPDVRVCLWNIQNFGQPSERYDGVRYRLGNGMRNQFIARLVYRYNIDVLMIQEVQPNSLPSLQDLQRKLNALHQDNQDWAYAWCGSAIANRQIEQPATAAQVILKTGGRSEGYAVFWRRDQDRFKLVDGLRPIAYNTGPVLVNPTSPLNISLFGRPTATLKINGIDRSANQDSFGASGGFTRARAYPNAYNPQTSNYNNLNDWPKLNYPPTSAADPNSVKWAKVRRPIYVVLKLGDDNAKLCPVSVYHAPSAPLLASWGAYMSGMARELYAIDKVDGLTPNPNDAQVATQVVFGGDFNHSVEQNDWPGSYGYFVRAYAATIDGGAACTVAPAPNAGNPARRTTVQIVEGVMHNEPIDSPNAADYLRHKIDLVFGSDNVVGQRIDLMAEVTGNDHYQLAIKHAYALMRGTEESIPQDPYRRMATTGPQYRKSGTHIWRPIICGSWGGTFIDWDESCRQFHAGRITDARRAAEYIHLFVSDHMPLLATVTY